MDRIENRKMTIIEKILIYSLILVCSFQGVFASINSYIDEIILLIFTLYEFVLNYGKLHKKINLKNIIPLIIFICITIINIVIKSYDAFAYFNEIINYLKIPIILFVFQFLNIQKKDFYNILLFFLFTNVISALEGIYHFTFYNKIGYHIGDKFRNGLYRAAGFSGHPISLGFSCLINTVILNDLKTNKIINKRIYYISLLIFIYALYLTQDRLPLLLIFIYFAILLRKFYSNKIKDGVIRFLTAIMVCCALIVFSIFTVSDGYINNYLSNDFENTIRIYSIKKSTEVFSSYPLMGTGIGTFGCSASLKYGSYVYAKFNIKRYENKYTSIKSSSNVYESFIAKLIIETGLFGLIMYIYLIKKIFILSKKNTNLKFLSFCMVVYSLLNSIYQMPFILGLGILLSQNNNSQEGDYNGGK